MICKHKSTKLDSFKLTNNSIKHLFTQTIQFSTDQS